MRPRSPKILVVDNDVTVLSTLAVLLRGCSLRFATDLSSALQEMQHDAADIVVADYSMRDGDGVSLLEIIRRVYPTARRVLMSADPPRYLRELLVARVIERFLSKPFGPQVRGELLRLARPAGGRRAAAVRSTLDLHGIN